MWKFEKFTWPYIGKQGWSLPEWNPLKGILSRVSSLALPVNITAMVEMTENDNRSSLLQHTFFYHFLSPCATGRV